MICVAGCDTAARVRGPWSVKAKRRGPTGSPCLTPLVERTMAESSGTARRKTHVGPPYAQDKKGSREGASLWAAWKMPWRNTLLKEYLQFRERSR
jgi:hypothetical protein